MPKATKPLREWRVSIIREKIQYLARVVAPDKEAAKVEPARRFRLIVAPVE